VHSKSWGYLQEDGTFDGMIGTLVRKEVDVGGTSILCRAERHEGKIISHLIFLLSLHNFHHCIAVPFSHSTDIISSFFSDRCFLCLLQVFLLISLICFRLSKGNVLCCITLRQGKK